MTNLLILDTETTGLDFESSEIIEFAAILYNLETKTILQQMSTLAPVSENSAYEVNRISLESSQYMKTKYMRTDSKTKMFDTALSMLCEMAKESEYLVAHNAEFDKSFIDAYHERYMPLFPLMDKKWICTKSDFKWPIRKGCMLNLVHICVDLGVPIVSAHRALADCQLIVSCFDKLDDLAERIQESTKPRAMYKAIISYDDRELAKGAGFNWDANVRAWTKKLSEDEAMASSIQVVKFGQ